MLRVNLHVFFFLDFVQTNGLHLVDSINSIFICRDVTFTDAGVYSCHATNKFGSANANGTLIVKG